MNTHVWSQQEMADQKIEVKNHARLQVAVESDGQKIPKLSPRESLAASSLRQMMPAPSQQDEKTSGLHG